MSDLMRRVMGFSLLIGFAALFLFGQSDHAHARTMTCESSTLNTFKSYNNDTGGAGLLILAETSSFIWGLDRDTCGARFESGYSYTESACEVFLNAYINSDEALAICALGNDPSAGLGFTRGGANITSVTLYKGDGSTTGVNVARDTVYHLSASTYYRITYNTKNDGRRVLTFTTNSALTGFSDSTITAYTDDDSPDIAISNVPPKTNSSVTFTAAIIASEEIVGLELSDINVTNGTASELTTVTDHLKFSVKITPNGNGDVKIHIPRGAVTDLADNENNPSNTPTSEYNTDAAVPEILGVPSTTDGSTPFTAYYNFSYPDGTPAPMTGFDITDVQAALVNATASAFTLDIFSSNARYYATITPDGNGSVSVGVNADAAIDASGFGNVAATTQVATMPDTTPPTVVATNDGPKLGGETATLDGSASSDASGIASYAWVQVDGLNSDTAASTNVVALNSTSAVRPFFTVPDLTTNANLYFKLTVTDNAGYSASAWTTYEALENTAPTVAITSNTPQTGGATATLDGSGSTDAGGIASYSWVQVDALDSDTAASTNVVTLTNADSATASFTVPSLATTTSLYFKLTVTDSNGNNASLWTTYAVTENTKPSVVITSNSPQKGGATATLNGTGSTDAGGIASYAWVQVDALNSDTLASINTVTLSNANSATASFTVPSHTTSVDLYFKLTVTDTSGNSASAWTTYTAVEDTAPSVTLSSNSPQTGGVTASLDGSGSTDAGGIASYAWIQVDALNSDTVASSNVVTLTNAAAAIASFTVPSLTTNTNLYFKLTVTDNAGNAASSWITYQAIENTAPSVVITNNGPQKGAATATLDGSGSTDAGGIASYAWVQVDALNSDTAASSNTVTLSNANSATASFTVPSLTTNTNLYFKLTIKDTSGNSASAWTTFAAVEDTAPSVSATSNSPQIGNASGSLDGSGSTDAGGIASYAWVQVDALNSDTAATANTVTLSNANSATASFTVPSVATSTDLYFKLTVTDSASNSASAWLTYSVVENTAPAVTITNNGPLKGGATASLDGSGSTDAGGIASYAWVQVDALNSNTAASTNTVTLTNANAATASFTVPSLTTNADLYFKLTVKDTSGNSASAWTTYSAIEDTAPSVVTSNNGPLKGGETGSLDGSGSTDAGGVASYAWVQVNALNSDTPAATNIVSLTNSATAVASFYVPSTITNVNLYFKLTVTDNNGNASSAWTTYQVIEDAAPSVVVSNDGPKAGNETANLDGSGSSDASGIASYQWVQVDAVNSSTPASTNTVSLTNASAAQASFTVPSVATNTELYFKLTVTDNNGNAASKWTTYAVIEDTPPSVSITNDGPKTGGETASLDGSGSSDAGGIASYAWVQVDALNSDVSPTTNIVILTDANAAQASFVVPDLTTNTQLYFMLTVTDNVGNKASAWTTYQAIENTAPTVVTSNDGPKTGGETGNLDGSSSSDAGGIASYQWVQVDVEDSDASPATNVVSLTNADAAQASFSVPSAVTNTELYFKLTVTDNSGNAASKWTTYAVIENTAPTVVVVNDGPKKGGDTAKLDGSGSTDASGIASYLWQQVDGLNSDTAASINVVALSDTMTDTATFTVPDLVASATLYFKLTVTDNSGNVASAWTAYSAIENTAPTLTISAPVEARGPFNATFTFSEDVTGFALADITVGNGTASDFTGANDVYTATITPVEHGPVTIDVGAGVAEDDPAGNPNTAADQVTVNYIDENYVRQRTSRIISNFMTRRGDAIASNQPDYTERLNQSGQGSSGAGASFSGEGSYSNNRMNFATSLRQMLSANKAKKNAQVSELGEMMKLGLQSKGTQSLGLRSNLATNAGAAAGFDLWVKGRWARYENDTNEGDLGLLFIGADYKFNDGLVIGLVAQFDWTDEVDDSEDFKINGRGWMVGPYLVAQLHQNLIFDANFSWGQSDNEVSPFNTYTDKFDGTRWLASAKFTGSFKFGNLHIAPHIGVMYYQERQDAYVDSLSIDIPSQTVKLGRLTFGPKISTTIQRKDGMTISPYVGVKGLWDFERTDIVDLTTGLAAESTDDLRARVDAGVSVRLPDGLTLNGEGFYDGIGADDYKSYGGSIRLNIPLQRDSSAADAMKLGIGLEKAAGIGQSSPKPAATKGENTIQR